MKSAKCLIFDKNEMCEKKCVYIDESIYIFPLLSNQILLGMYAFFSSLLLHFWTMDDNINWNLSFWDHGVQDCILEIWASELPTPDIIRLRRTYL